MAEISRICCFYTYQENSCTSMYIYIMQPELLKIILLVFRRFFYSVLPLTLPTKMFNSVHSCIPNKRMGYWQQIKCLSAS